MGRIFLIGIVAAGIYGAWSVYGSISKITHPEKPPAAKLSRAPEPQKVAETGGTWRDVAGPVASVVKKNEPLPVLSSNHEWIQIEGWAIVSKGEPLPDGSTLESWDKWHAVVVTESGRREKRRFRTASEAFSKLARAMTPVASADPAPVVNWGANK